ncbi:hypothetical protein CRG98_021427 [Punica granatum]|uniref:Uncharacterized protein n=1 Tax=Punica granatum TaxID=22663 RepID=A0A2I0JPD2_PUNGR|nr:hypothetical protein CRG98_021427 [Punica granatum]
MHRLTPFRELLSSLLPYTLTGKGLGTEGRQLHKLPTTSHIDYKRPGHSRSTLAPRPPRTSSTHDKHFQATYTGASPVEVLANTTSASNVHWASLVEVRPEVAIVGHSRMPRSQVSQVSHEQRQTLIPGPTRYVGAVLELESRNTRRRLSANFLQGSVPFGYVPTTFLHRGPSPSGTSRLLFCTGVRPVQGKTSRTLQTRRATRPASCKSIGGPSPSGTSRLLFNTGVRPLRVRPDYFSAQGSVPFGYVPTTFSCTMQTAGQNTPHLANPPGNKPRILQVHWVGAFEPCCSFGMRPVHIANLSGTSRLLFYSGVRPLWVRPDYFSAQRFVPFGYVLTTFLPRGPSPSGTSRLLFSIGVRPLRVRSDYFSAQGSFPFGYVSTTFSYTMQTAEQNTPHLANPPGNTPRILQVHWVGAFEPCCSFGMRPVHIANLSGTSRLLFCSGVRPLRVRPDYFSAQGSVPFGYVPTTFLLRGLSPSGVRPDYFSAQGFVPFGYVPTTFLLRGPSPSEAIQTRAPRARARQLRALRASCASSCAHSHAPAHASCAPRAPPVHSSRTPVHLAPRTCMPLHPSTLPSVQPSNSGHDAKDLSRSLPGRPTGSLAFSRFLHNPGRSRELVDTDYRPRWPAL